MQNDESDLIKRLDVYARQNVERDQLEAEVRDRVIAAMNAFHAQVTPYLERLRPANSVSVATHQVLTSMQTAKMQLVLTVGPIGEPPVGGVDATKGPA